MAFISIFERVFLIFSAYESLYMVILSHLITKTHLCFLLFSLYIFLKKEGGEGVGVGVGVFQCFHPL